MSESDWTLDDDRCWNLKRDGVHVWIAQRPSYCDRGHYVANVNGMFTIDGADAFPRYFMDLERAKAEMSDWLTWRLHQEKAW